jgi:hypothetical protein
MKMVKSNPYRVKKSPLGRGIRGGFFGHEISVNISRITDLPTPKSPPKRGIICAIIKYVDLS